MIKLKITTIQLYEDTKTKLNAKKDSPKESYDSVIRKLLEKESIPSMEEMFNQGDKIKQKKCYTTEEVINLTHELRGKQ